MIQQMLESGKPAEQETVTHIDRCLSCFSCMTTCPSGVDYMHLVDHARQYVEDTYQRPAFDRILRNVLGIILPRPHVFRLALLGATFAKPFKGIFSGRIRAMLDMAPSSIPQRSILDELPVHAAEGNKRLKRVVLMTGCAQKVLSPDINDATIRLLTRHGVEVVIPKEAGCCGALPLHMGQENPAMAMARKNIEAWHSELTRDGLDAIIINTSGCGTTVKDYGHMFELDEGLSEKAKTIGNLAKDITEFLADLDLKTENFTSDLRIAYHSACSLQHGQKITDIPKDLLSNAGFEVYGLPEAHICCGSAGTYNLLQPELSSRLKERKVNNIKSLAPDLVSAGNIGCIEQIASGMDLPVVHTVQLLDWASGGPKPEAIS